MGSDSARRRTRLGLLTAALALTTTVVGIGVSTGTSHGSATKVTICHATGSGRWVVESPSAASLIGGHGHHPGDIIPPFVYEQGQRSVHYGGHNLGALTADGITGQAVIANGCRLPDRPPTPAATTATAPAATLAPPTPGTAAPDTTAPGPTPTPATTAVPDTLPAAVPTTAPFPQVTTPPLCPDGEFAHEGSCFPIPPLRVPTVAVPLVTGPGPDAPVPIVECATRRGDEVITWFGYVLDGVDAVKVERGTANALSPNGVPPTLFGPGLHARVVSTSTPDGAASWTLAGTTATADASTPDCDTIVDLTSVPPTEPATTDPSTTDPVTTEPATTDPATTDPVEPATTDPSTTDPVTTEPATTDPVDPVEPATTDPVEPVELVLVDNYMECDGHAVARFAAFNTNGAALGGPGFRSVIAPQRLTGLAPTVIGDEVIASDGGRDLAEIVDIRYVTAVSWTVSHDGFEVTTSAGVGNARSNPACPSAHVESTGLDGGTPAPMAMPTTGFGPTWTTWLVATLVLLVGALVVLIGRPDPTD